MLQGTNIPGGNKIQIEIFDFNFLKGRQGDVRQGDGKKGEG